MHLGTRDAEQPAPSNTILSGPFEGMPHGKAGLILCDPPWRFNVRNRDTGLRKSADLHYDTMTLDDIKALPVADLAARDCTLVMWATAPFLRHALDTIDAWGFTYKTMGAWAKRTRTDASWAFGTGYVLRSASEPYLFASRGKPRVAVRNVRNLIVAPLREHSRKPDQMHDDLERMFPDVVRLELFARQSREGWLTWGNQRSLFDPNPEGTSHAH